LKNLQVKETAMRPLYRSNRKCGKTSFAARFFVAVALLICMLLAACDAPGVNNNGNYNGAGNGNNGSCNGINNCNTNNNVNPNSSTGNSSSTPVAPPTPTPTPKPKTYHTDWSSGMDGWTATNDWHAVNGMLINDGTLIQPNGNPTALAPYPPQDIVNYSVQVEIRLDKYTDAGGNGSDSFGIAIRYSDNSGGFKFGTCAGASGLSLVMYCDATSWDVYHVLIFSDGNFSSDTPVKKVPFQPGYGNWHTYRLDANGNMLTAWLDGNQIFQVTDDKYLAGGSVGLWSDHCQISVRSFTLTPL
jgi:hypothetical protein